MAIIIRQSIGPSPARSREQHVVLEPPVAAGDVPWELDFDVVAHPVAVGWLGWQGLIHAWGLLFKHLLLPKDWSDTKTLLALHAVILINQILWNWEEGESARLGQFIRLEDPAEVSSLLRHILSVPEADLRGLDVVGLEHLDGYLTAFSVVSIIKTRSTINTLRNTLHKGIDRGDDRKNIGCH